MPDRIGAHYTQFIYMSLHFRRATSETGRLFTVTGQQLFDIHAAAFFRKFEKLRFSSFELRFLNLRIANPIRGAVSIGCVNQWFVEHKFRKSKFHEILKLVRGLELQIHKNSSLARFQCLVVLAFGNGAKHSSYLKISFQTKS